MVRLSLAVIVTSMAAVGCGGSGSPPSSSDPPAGGGERITGSERLGWNQAASSAGELSSLRFAAYLDGVNRVALSDVSCNTSGAAFQCSSRMPSMGPGSHSIELVSIASNGSTEIESARSARLHVLMAGATAPADSDAAPLTDLRATTADGVSLRLAAASGVLKDPTALAFVSADRAFVGERIGRIRILIAGTVQSSHGGDDVAIELQDVVPTGDSEGGLIDLVPDPAFESTRFVYALYTTAPIDGVARFRVARFREAGGRLGERAVLLDRIPASSDGPAASIAFGPDGKLYIAFDDGGDPAQAQRAASYSGKVLRLNPDGTIPVDRAGAGPVYSAPYRSPRGLDWHPGTNALWIVDEVAPGAQELRIVARATPRHIHPSTRVFALPSGTGASSMAFYRGPLLPAFQGNLLVAAGDGRHLLRVRFDGRDSARVSASERLFADLGTAITLVAVAPDGAVYLGTNTAVLRLGPG
jgi:glucose/arabinose dehydrogenase